MSEIKSGAVKDRHSTSSVLIEGDSVAVKLITGTARGIKDLTSDRRP